MALPYGSPTYQITLDGKDITSNFGPRLIRLNLVDNRGLDADELDIELDDSDGKLILPEHGQKITVAIGWSHSQLVNKGVFAVDESEHRGTPDVVAIRARSDDISTGLLAKQDYSFHDTTIGDIIEKLAGDNNLTAKVDPELAKIEVPHLDQTGESAVNLLTRLGMEHDAVATIKSGTEYGFMLFMPIGKGASITGQPLGHVNLTRQEGDNHRYLKADRQGDTYTGVRAIYHDVPGALRKEAIAGTDDRPKELRHTYTDVDSALRAAKAEWQRLQRQEKTLSYTLALGRPELLPEMTFSLEGIKQEISDITWLCRQVIHSITGEGGYTTSMEFETKLEEGA